MSSAITARPAVKSLCFFFSFPSFIPVSNSRPSVGGSQHLQFWGEQQAGNESEEDRDSMFLLGGAEPVFGKILANVKRKKDVNQETNVLKGCWLQVHSHDQRAHIYTGGAVACLILD